jgi:L-threonylcarbamoyladenylate synthase
MILPPTSENLQKAADLLKNEGIVAFPTETVYGLGGLARSDRAVLKIYETKERPSYNPLIVHVDSFSQAQDIGIFDTFSKKIVSLFWPGPLTIIVPLNPKAYISPLATAGLKTVAIRFPNHPLLLTLLRLVKEPLVAPSANLSGFLTSTTAAHVQRSLPSVFVLEGGETQQGLESTIIRPEEGVIFILRSGALSQEEIEQKTKAPSFLVEHHDKISSPGQSLQHYAPLLPVRINVIEPHKNEAFLGFGKTKHTPTLNLSPSSSLEEAAHNLFSFLHILDDPSRYEGIAVSPVPHTGIGVAINDRLKRASSSSCP